MVTNNDEACHHLLCFIQNFDTPHYPSKNVSAACVRIKEICCVLTPDHLPQDLLHHLLDGFSKASTDDFRTMCSTQRVNYNSHAYQHLWAHQTLSTQLTNMLCNLEDTYHYLLTGSRREGPGHTSTTHQESAFLSTTTDPEMLDDFAAYQASSGRLPFNQLVCTQKCHYCSQTGHIQCHCCKMQADTRNGTYQGTPPSSHPTSTPDHQPSTQQPCPSTHVQPTQHKFNSFRKSVKYQVLKAALEDINDSDLTTADDHTENLLDDDTTDVETLLCNLGLND